MNPVTAQATHLPSAIEDEVVVNVGVAGSIGVIPWRRRLWIAVGFQRRRI